jgi:hypothetical protein
MLNLEEDEDNSILLNARRDSFSSLKVQQQVSESTTDQSSSDSDSKNSLSWSSKSKSSSETSIDPSRDSSRDSSSESSAESSRDVPYDARSNDSSESETVILKSFETKRESAKKLKEKEIKGVTLRNTFRLILRI